MKVTRCQGGFSFVEIMVSLAIIAVIAGYITTKMSDARKVANDGIAQVALRDVQANAQLCWNLYQYTDAEVVNDNVGMKLNCFKEGKEKTLLTLSEGVKGTLRTEDSKIVQLGVYHAEGTKQILEGQEHPTAFCLGGNGEVVTTAGANNCPELF